MKEIYRVNEKLTSYDIQANELANIRKKDITRKGARIFENNKILMANYLGRIDDQKLLEAAAQNGAIAQEYKYELVIASKYDKNFTFLKESNSIDEIEELMTYLKSELPDFLFSGKLSSGVISKSITNDQGLDLNVVYPSGESFLIYKKKGSPNIADGYFEAPISSFVDFKKAAKFQAPYLQKFDDIASIKAGKHNVCFATVDRAFLKMVYEAIEPDRYHSGATLFAGQLGEKILSEKIAISDVKVDEVNGIFVPFDGDGVIREEPLEIIKGGVLTNVLYDKRRSAKYGAPSTGNGQRRYNSGVMPQPVFLDIAGGEKTIVEQLHDLESCVMILMAGGGDTTSDGDFSTPVQLSFLVEKGEIIGKLPQLTLSANIKNYLGDDLIAVSKDQVMPGLSRAIFCKMDLMVN